MALQDYLARFYAARQFGKETPSVVIAAFKTAAQNDASLVTAAEARLTSLTDDVVERCYCSKMYRDFLRAALNQ